MANAWSKFKSLGVLPFAGQNLIEQPAFIVEAFTLCEETKSTVEADAHRKDLKGHGG